MAQIWHLWPEATKISLKNLKTWRHQLYSDGRFETLTNSGRSLTWAYKLKALKSFSQISATNVYNACDYIVVCITVLLSMQQFYITKMMILIFSIIEMRSYLYSVCLVSRVLKNTYFKEHPWVIASKYSIYDKENNT